MTPVDDFNEYGVCKDPKAFKRNTGREATHQCFGCGAITSEETEVGALLVKRSPCPFCGFVIRNLKKHPENR